MNLKTYYEKNKSFVDSSLQTVKKYVEICKHICKHCPTESDSVYLFCYGYFIHKFKQDYKDYSELKLNKNTSNWVTVSIWVINSKGDKQLYIIDISKVDERYTFVVTTRIFVEELEAIYPSCTLAFNSKESKYKLYNTTEKIFLN